MAKIKSPNSKYNGVSGSITFVNGEAETDKPWLIQWFKEKGYEVDDSAEQEAKAKAEEEAKAKAEAARIKKEEAAKKKAEEQKQQEEAKKGAEK